MEYPMIYYGIFIWLHSITNNNNHENTFTIHRQSVWNLALKFFSWPIPAQVPMINRLFTLSSNCIEIIHVNIDNIFVFQ